MDYFTKVTAVLDWIEGRLGAGIGLEEAAAVACLSPSRFATVFKAATGVPLASWIRARRLAGAARELASGERRIVEVAFAFGFESHEAFARAFRRQYGTSPSAYRAAGGAPDQVRVAASVFGPIPCLKEDDMAREASIERSEGRIMLHGVPKVGYFGNPPELCPFPSSLRACLGYLGEDIPYAELLAASGAAFRLMWNTEYWDGGNVDILVCWEDAAEPLRRACAAAGRDLELVWKRPGRKRPGFSAPDEAAQARRLERRPSERYGEREDFVALLRRELDAGRPLVGFGLIGPPEAGIVAGYEEDGTRLAGWSYFQDMPEFSAGISRTSEGYFLRGDWYESPEMIGLLALPAEAARPDPAELARDTLSFAARIMAPRRLGNHAGGLSAFDAFAAALRVDADFPRDGNLPSLIEKNMCVSDALGTVAEGRYYASTWLASLAERFPRAAGALRAAAEPFAAEHDLCWKAWAELGGVGVGEKQARALTVKARRERVAALVGAMRALDEKAIGLVEAAREAI